MNTGEPHPNRILVPVDGSEGSLAAVAEVIRRSRNQPPPYVYLLTVLPSLGVVEVLSHLPEAAGDAYFARSGAEALAQAKAMLGDAGISHATRCVAGPVVDTILEQREELGCDTIVMGTHGRGRALNALLGSTAAGVVHRSPVAVTLVKANLPTASDTKSG